MNKPNKILMAFILMLTVVSAAVISIYISEDRDLEVLPWLTYGLNYGEPEIYGGANPLDYINVTSTRGNAVFAEIHTDILFNGGVLEDSEGLAVHYFVTNGFGDIDPAVDTNFNGIPDVTLWGTSNTPNGFTVIQRRIITSTDLEHGTYTLSTKVLPREV